MGTVDRTEVASIIERARSTDVPETWAVFPLDLNAVKLGLAGWIGGMLLGGGLLAIMLAGTDGQWSFLVVIFIAVLAFLFFGSLWLAIKKARQLLHPDSYIIVLTNDTFVQQEEQRMSLVPLTSITHLTLKGDRTQTKETLREAMPNTAGAGILKGFVGQERRKRQGQSLAFVDARDNSVVKVADDNSYAPLAALEECMQEYIDGAHRLARSSNISAS
jgi:hypothetical protein